MKRETLNTIVDVALIAGICFLAYNGLNGWGWLVFILVIRD